MAASTGQKTVTVVQTGSPIGRRSDQEATLKGLGSTSATAGARSRTPRRCAA